MPAFWSRWGAATRRPPGHGSGRWSCWYRGDGWYVDGDGRDFDHYNGWALHLYPMLDAQLAGDDSASAHHWARLRGHLESFS